MSPRGVSGCRVGPGLHEALSASSEPSDRACPLSTPLLRSPQLGGRGYGDLHAAQGGPQQARGAEGAPIWSLSPDTWALLRRIIPLQGKGGPFQISPGPLHPSGAVHGAGAEKRGEEGLDTEHGWSGRRCARDALKCPLWALVPSELCQTRPPLGAGEVPFRHRRGPGAGEKSVQMPERVGDALTPHARRMPVRGCAGKQRYRTNEELPGSRLCSGEPAREGLGAGP